VGHVWSWREESLIRLGAVATRREVFCLQGNTNQVNGGDEAVRYQLATKKALKASEAWIWQFVRRQSVFTKKPGLRWLLPGKAQTVI
jgi:hypothetical protein